MEDLRLAIIVLGVFSILGILIHGLWTIRKNAAAKDPEHQQHDPNELHSEAQGDEATMHQASLSPYSANRDTGYDDPLNSPENNHQSPPHFASTEFSRSDSPQQQPSSTPGINIADPQLDTDPHAPDINLDIPREPSVRLDDGASGSFDTDGIGQVRVVKQDSSLGGRPYSIKKEPVKKESPNENGEPDLQNTGNSFPEPPSSLLKSGDGDDSVVAVTTTRIESRQKSQFSSSSAKPKEKVSLTARARQFVSGNDKPERATGKRVEPRVDPRLGEDQIRMDFDQNEPRTRFAADKPAPEHNQSNEPPEQEVLVLNVKMPDGKLMSGAALLPALLTLGFKFGEQDVFHRHANSNGKGPKLFSLANMFKPGTFNLDNMETFNTQGISLFMILPIEGDPQQVFNMMHNAARKLADEFGAQILDTRRSLLTKQSLQQYVEKIREFERKRMINRT